MSTALAASVNADSTADEGAAAAANTVVDSCALPTMTMTTMTTDAESQQGAAEMPPELEPVYTAAMDTTQKLEPEPAAEPPLQQDEQEQLQQQLPELDDLNDIDRPPGGYKYSMEFLYSIGSSLAGMTLDIPAPASMTPRGGQPGVNPLFPLARAATDYAAGMNYATAQAGTGGLSPTPFIYPSYMTSSQRRLWHPDVAVFQFDRNYPYATSFAGQYGVPLMPLGFEHRYGAPRYVYPNYYNQAIPHMPRQTRQEQVAEQLQETENNSSSHEHNYRRNRSSGQRYSAARNGTDSKNYYNSNSARRRNFDGRNGQQQQQEPMSTRSNSSNNSDQSKESARQRQQPSKQQKQRGSGRMQLGSQSSGSLSTSSTERQMNAVQEDNATSANGTAGAHPQRSYRNRTRYNNGAELSTRTSNHVLSVTAACYVPKQKSQYEVANQNASATVDYVRPTQPQNTRYYQARNVDKYVIPTGYMSYVDPNMAAANRSNAENEAPLMQYTEFVPQTPIYMTPPQLEPTQSAHNLYLRGVQPAFVQQQPEQHYAAAYGGSNYEDAQSYASLEPSSSSDSGESDLSEASVQSMVRKIALDCAAQAAGTLPLDLSGPNLVPYGDMLSLNELHRHSQNGFKYPYALMQSEKLAPENAVLENATELSILEQPLATHNMYWHESFGYTPADRFLQRAHLVEMKHPPRHVQSRAKWDTLSMDIWQKFLNAQQTKHLYKTKMRLWRLIYTSTLAAYPHYGMYLVGSSISYFGSKCSDMDICMLACTNNTMDPRTEALYHLHKMQDLLQQTNVFEEFNLIEARVPILRFKDRESQLEVDINYNNSVGIRNTHLLYCYSQLEWRVRPIALTVKKWAQYHNINNAKNMTISSYSLILMVIHFLQAGVTPPVLPCLHMLLPDKFDFMRPHDFGYVDMNEIMSPYRSENTQTLGDLLLNFLRYYSEFEYEKYGISIRTGGVLPLELCRSSQAAKNDIFQWNELCIEEPFDQTNTARSVHDSETFERVKAIFKACYKRLESTRNLSSIFENYVGPTIATPTTEFMSDVKNTVSSNKLMVDKAIVALWNDIGEKPSKQSTAGDQQSLAKTFKAQLIEQLVQINMETDTEKTETDLVAIDANANAATATANMEHVESVAEPLAGQSS